MVICMTNPKLFLTTSSLLTPSVWVLDWPVACVFQAYVLQHRCRMLRFSDLMDAVRADTHGPLDMNILCSACAAWAASDLELDIEKQLCSKIWSRPASSCPRGICIRSGS